MSCTWKCAYTHPPYPLFWGTWLGAAGHGAQCAASPDDTALMWLPGGPGDPTNGQPGSLWIFTGHLPPQITSETKFCVCLGLSFAFGTFGSKSRIRVTDQTIDGGRGQGAVCVSHPLPSTCNRRFQVSRQHGRFQMRRRGVTRQLTISARGGVLCNPVTALVDGATGTGHGP